MSRLHMRVQRGTVAQARALVAQDTDEMPPAQMGEAEGRLLQALAEVGEAVLGLCSDYLYSGDPASLDPDVACYAEKVAVKTAGQLARVQLWLRAPLSSGPDGD